MRYFFILMMFLTVTGCKTSGAPTPGSSLWHEQRLADLEDARRNNRLTDEQYNALRNQVDQIRVYYDRTYPRDPWPTPYYRRGAGYVGHRHR